MRHSNYDKYPATRIAGTVVQGWDDVIACIRQRLESENINELAVELYTGVYEDEVKKAFSDGLGVEVTDTRDLMKPEEEVRRMTDIFMTDDVLFGYVTALRINDFFDQEKLASCKGRISGERGLSVVIGTGASLAVSDKALVVYVDMARWEIQQRFRRHEVKALGIDNHDDPVSIQYKRGFFNDWRVCDIHKDCLFHRVVYWIDTHIAGQPKMIDSETFFKGIDATVKTPFRVVPFFDPAPWGGQWMKEVCDLDRSRDNFGWCFDCVPEENSLYFEVNGVRFELPSVDLVLLRSRELLGEPVEARFGKDFPIRFDFLDTMGGGNLSLQVHPTTQFIRENFGMAYTQDESYYLLDCDDTEETYVYLGVKKGIDPKAMERDLRLAQKGEIEFPAETYVNKVAVKPHDHILIPAGTVHCSGKNTMVLEISATPYIFTFKLWDWGRVGLDGLPRPIHIEHGMKNIQWDRDTDWIYENLVHQQQVVEQGIGYEIQRTGLHNREFIDTMRYTLTDSYTVNMEDSVHVMNLVGGSHARIESVDESFEPFELHYAETMSVPASVGRYKIVSEKQEEIKLIVASIRK